MATPLRDTTPEDRPRAAAIKTGLKLAAQIMNKEDATSVKSVADADAGQGDRAGVAKPGKRGVVAVGGEAERLQHELAVRAADLMADRLVD